MEKCRDTAGDLGSEPRARANTLVDLLRNVRIKKRLHHIRHHLKNNPVHSKFFHMFCSSALGMKCGIFELFSISSHFLLQHVHLRRVRGQDDLPAGARDRRHRQAFGRGREVPVCRVHRDQLDQVQHCQPCRHLERG